MLKKFKVQTPNFEAEEIYDIEEEEDQDDQRQEINESEQIGTICTQSRQETEVMRGPAISNQSVFYKHKLTQSQALSFDNSRNISGILEDGNTGSNFMQNVDKDQLFEAL